MKQEKAKAVHRMPLVKKASQRVDSNLKPKETESSDTPKYSNSLQQEGLKPNNAMRRVQTVQALTPVATIVDPNIPADYNPKVEKPSAKKSKVVRPSRSVRFGDNEVKEFVRESAEIKFNIPEDKVIITQADDLIKQYESEDREVEVPLYKPYSSTGSIPESETYADPEELADRLDRLKAIAETILNVSLKYSRCVF